MTETTLKEEKRNQAVLVGLNAHSLPPEDNATETTLEELAALLETAGGECVGTVLQNKDKPDARTFIGEGKVDEVRELAQAVDADLIVFDNEISPAQVRVLTEDIGVQVMDRAGLILDIFAQRARTREGRLQVALAQYKYLLPARPPPAASPPSAPGAPARLSWRPTGGISAEKSRSWRRICRTCGGSGRFSGTGGSKTRCRW